MAAIIARPRGRDAWKAQAAWRPSRTGLRLARLARTRSPRPPHTGAAGGWRRAGGCLQRLVTTSATMCGWLCRAVARDREDVSRDWVHACRNADDSEGSDDGHP